MVIALCFCSFFSSPKDAYDTDMSRSHVTVLCSGCLCTSVSELQYDYSRLMKTHLTTYLNACERDTIHAALLFI